MATNQHHQPFDPTTSRKAYWHALAAPGTPPGGHPVLEVWPAVEGGYGFTVWAGGEEVSESGQAPYATKEEAFEFGLVAAQNL